jgi:hypothetical protein
MHQGLARILHRSFPPCAGTLHGSRSRSGSEEHGVLWVDISFAGGLIKRRVEIKIRDNGTGIPPEVKEKVREEVRRDLGDMGGAIEVEVEIRFGIDSRIDNRVAGLLTKLGSLMTLGVVVDQGWRRSSVRLTKCQGTPIPWCQIRTPPHRASP